LLEARSHSIMASRLIFLRHGETSWNAAGRMTSRSDVPLNAVGQRQANAVGRALARTEIAHIVSSPAIRAQQTASEVVNAIVSETGSPAHKVILDPRLRELDFGIAEGLTKDQIFARGLGSCFYGWLDGSKSETPPSAESFAEAEARAKSAFADLVAERAPVLLVVTHGHFSRILLATCVLGTTATCHRRLRFDNGLLADVRIEDQYPRLVALNAHEPPLI